MYYLAVPEGVHDNRCLDYLKNFKELRDDIDFERSTTDNETDEGWVNYTFPDMDEDQFRYIVEQLRNNGVTMDHVDTQLTEKKIMKLSKLLNELAPTTEEKNKPKNLMILDKFLKVWKDTEYQDDKHRAESYYEDIKGLVSSWKSSLEEDEEKGAQDKTDGMFSENKKSKIRNIIRKTIRK
mgnify:FL=1